MQPHQPHQPIQPVVGDPSAWPARPAPQFSPYGVSINAGDLLGRTWSAWRGDALRLTLITGLPYGFLILGVIGVVVAGVVMGFNLDRVEEGGAFLGLLIGGGGGLMVSAWLLMVAAMAGTWMVVEERLRGEDRSAGAFSALLGGLHALGRLTVAYLIVGVAMTIVMAPALALSAGAVVAESWAMGGGALLLWCPTLIAIFIATLRLVAAGPAIVAEDLGAIAGLRRSMELTRGHVVADVFVACLAFGGVLMAVNMMVSILGLITIVGMFVQLAFGVVLGSVQATFLFLLYAGLRDRQG